MPVCFSFANLIFILIHVLLLIQFRVARVGYPIAAVIGVHSGQVGSLLQG